MSDIENTFAQVVTERLDQLKKNAFAVEKEGGLPVDAIRSVIRKDAKRAIPRLTRAKEICDLLGLELYIGPPISEEAKQNAQQQAPQLSDHNRLLTAIRVVEKAFAESKRKVKPERKAEVIVAAYELLEVMGDDAEEKVIKLVRAA